MLDTIARINDAVRGVLWGPPLLILLLGTGLYFTCCTGVFHLRYIRLWLGGALRACLPHRKTDKDGQAISPFAAMCTALAATVGTGNIAGVAAALAIGGPGAVFWMWVAAFFGMMTAFAENTLGMLYRRRDADGAWHGGPMYYLKDGLHAPMLAAAFSLCCALASFGIGNMSQCNSIAGGLSGVFGVRPLATGLATAALLGAVLLGGLKRLSRVTSLLVPAMALFYMGGALIVLWCRREYIPQACGQILSGAFGLRAAGGGAAGFGLMQAMRVGVSRGVFSNEAGLGSSVMVHTAADAKEPCAQGMLAVFEVFFDTIVMCTVTALVVLTAGVYDPAQYARAVGTPLFDALPTGAALTAQSFSAVFGPAGGAFVAVSLALFAFSTLLGWSYYGQGAVRGLLGERAVPVYQMLFVAAACAGCTMRLELAWALSDTFNALMALPNLVGVLALRRDVLAEWRRYARANHI